MQLTRGVFFNRKQGVSTVQLTRLCPQLPYLDVNYASAATTARLSNQSKNSSSYHLHFLKILIHILNVD